MNTTQRFSWSLLLVILLPLTVGAQDSDEKIHDSGIGFSFSSGQSMFYTRATNPFNTNHTYLAMGFHSEGEGLAVVSDPWTVDYYGNPVQRLYPKQRYYLEQGWGLRHLWFRDSMAGMFLPHSSIEAGVSGFITQWGKLRNYFQEFSLCWMPYLQVASGASIYTGTAIYRFEMGYVATLPVLPSDVFPHYEGVYLKIVISSGQKSR
ncbi:hypothetical protein ACFL4K_03565 [Candidatus Neomarinimicrobiota bacterium]